MLATSRYDNQGVLFYIVESDDSHLEQCDQVAWFSLLRDLDWRPLQPVAAKYYEALYQFNIEQALQRSRILAPNAETESEATERLLFERATLDEEVAVLHEPAAVETECSPIDPGAMRPGAMPLRMAGRAPKCFFAMLKAFIGVAVSGVAPEPENVHAKLIDNPAFARTCGFTLPDPAIGYRQSDVPSLRKLEQFDQIMANTGLWGDASLAQVRENISNERITIEPTIVHDTTHYPAYSEMRSVEIPGQTSAADEDSQADSAPTSASTEAKAKTKGKGKKKQKPRKKSHPKTIKNCRCADRDSCGHPWINGDEGVGTVVKSTGKKYWAHKASTISFAGQEVLLDVVAMSDAATHDSRSLPDQMDRLFVRLPELKGKITRVLDDGAADDLGLMKTLRETWNIELLTPINPRSRKPLTTDLPKGVDHVTRTGVPTCIAGYPMDFIGCRHADERFIFRAPDDESGQPVCAGCQQREGCYRGQTGARQVTIPFERLPWIDPKFPQHSKRFAKAMARRTVIERLHKLMKYDYGDERLSKRGNHSFQARLDKTLLAMHMVIAQR
jgi:hypothetical protein